MKLWTGKDFLAQVPPKRLADVGRHEAAVRTIVEDVQRRGDAALLEYTARFDRAVLSPAELLISEAETAAAYEAVGLETLAALTQAKENIAAFHRRQLRSDWFSASPDGSLLGQMYRPIDRVGIYIPGGTAKLCSSVLMTAVPARVAGVPEIIICTPPDATGAIDPHVLVAADMAGATCVCKAGGAQAVAALAFGTETIPAVDKIVGPGNIYVTTAKKIVYGQVDIDMLAGPSEVVILADGKADPRYVAADLLAQAEHDALATAILLTPDRELTDRVGREIERQITALPRQEIAARSLADNGAAVLVRDMEEAVVIINRFAPEHLEVLTENPLALLGRIRHAGSVFLGPYSPEAAGDYTVGPSHVLPTGGTARFYSALGVDSFRKASNLIALSCSGFAAVQDSTGRLAAIEGLAGHASAVKVRGER